MAKWKPPTLKQYREAAQRAFELMASGVERQAAYKKVALKNDISSSSLEYFAEWRLLHLDDEWSMPPDRWQTDHAVAELTNKSARWHWTCVLHDAAIQTEADATGQSFEDVQMDFINDGRAEATRKKIESEWPAEGVDYHALLTQHFREMAGVETPKVLPAPALALTVEQALTKKETVS